MKSLPTKTKLCALVAAILAVIGSLVAIGADKSTEEQWQPLFNGRDLRGWVPMHGATFVVTNGNLRLVGGMGWLRTEKQYSDFVLEVEWRALVTGYDSGIFVRSGLEGKPFPDGHWQVDLNGGAVGGLVHASRTVVPAETPRMPLNKWVKFRIEARGRKISLDVDGERVWEYDQLEPGRGYIGIQAEDKAFDFRNVRIRELAATSSPEK